MRLGEVDEITLDIHGTVVERLDDPNDASDDAVVEDEGTKTPWPARSPSPWM